MPTAPRLLSKRAGKSTAGPTRFFCRLPIQASAKRNGISFHRLPEGWSGFPVRAERVEHKRFLAYHLQIALSVSRCQAIILAVRLRTFRGVDRLQTKRFTTVSPPEK